MRGKRTFCIEQQLTEQKKLLVREVKSTQPTPFNSRTICNTSARIHALLTASPKQQVKTARKQLKSSTTEILSLTENVADLRIQLETVVSAANQQVCDAATKCDSLLDCMDRPFFPGS